MRSISHKTFLQILPVIISNGKNIIKTNAILDTGSDATLIRQDVARKLIKSSRFVKKIRDKKRVLRFVTFQFKTR